MKNTNSMNGVMDSARAGMTRNGTTFEIPGQELPGDRLPTPNLTGGFGGKAAFAFPMANQRPKK